MVGRWISFLGQFGPMFRGRLGKWGCELTSLKIAVKGWDPGDNTKRDYQTENDFRFGVPTPRNQAKKSDVEEPPKSENGKSSKNTMPFGLFSNPRMRKKTPGIPIQVHPGCQIKWITNLDFNEIDGDLRDFHETKLLFTTSHILSGKCRSLFCFLGKLEFIQRFPNTSRESKASRIRI